MTSHPHRYLFAGLLLISGWLHAQTAPAPSAPQNPSATETDARKQIPVEATEKADEPVKLEAVEVTGTRIRTLGDEAAAIPVFTLPQIELERRGVTRLADIRLAIPQLGGAVGFNDNLQNSGTSRAQTVGTSFNMRGLGGNSTLVLIDGRRIPHTGQEAPGGAGGREDFSVDGIPISAIERIDILPEGAGAIYGSEAIAGVVNIVLKKNYTGAELRVTYDNTFDTDVAQTTVSLTAGYRAGKLSTFLTASFEEQNSLALRDRWWTATYDNRKFGSTSNSFLFNVTGGAGSLASGFNPANSAGANLPGLTTHVVLLPAGSNGTTAANGAYTPTNAACVPVYDAAPYTMGIDPASRQSFMLRADYQLRPRIQIYGDVRWSQFENNYTGSPITLQTTLPAGYPGNPFSSSAVLAKVFYDLPLPRIDSFQKNMGGSAGVRGDFLDTWRYDVSASWSRNIVSDDAISASSFNFSLLNAAIASATKPILAYDSSTTKNPNAPGVLEALLPAADHEDTTDVYQYLASVDGTVWSGWAGDMRAAMGVEFGEEKVKFWREASIATPTFVLTKPFSRELKAAFAEVSIPLLSHKQGIPLVHLFEVGGAIRATEYSDAGGVTTSTYRGLYQPVKWLTLRASRAEGFKPVRLYDLQAPINNFTTTYTSSRNIRDPLRGNELVLGTFTYQSGGNPSLKSEESVSKNGGVVIDVPGRWFKGLSFSADYYEIDYRDRSGSTGLQDLMNFFPERVTRAAPTPADTAAGYAGLVTTWDARNVNLSWVKTKGWDYRAIYSRTFGFGDLTVTAAYTDPNVILSQTTPSSTPSSAFGHQPSKLSGSVFLGRGPWDFGVVVNSQNRYYINGLTSAAYPEYIEYNPQVSYDFRRDARFAPEAPEWWARYLAGSKVTVTIINALNEEPSRADAANSRFTGDPRLRRYIISFAKKF